MHPNLLLRHWTQSVNTMQKKNVNTRRRRTIACLFHFHISNSRHVRFNLTFQFQTILQFSALNMDLVTTRVCSGQRPRQVDNCGSSGSTYILAQTLTRRISTVTFDNTAVVLLKSALANYMTQFIVYTSTLFKQLHGSKWT